MAGREGGPWVRLGARRFRAVGSLQGRKRCRVTGAGRRRHTAGRRAEDERKGRMAATGSYTLPDEQGPKRTQRRDHLFTEGAQCRIHGKMGGDRLWTEGAPLGKATRAESRAQRAGARSRDRRGTDGPFREGAPRGSGARCWGLSARGRTAGKR